MKTRRSLIRKFVIAGCCFAAFLLWTLFVCCVDVNSIGPNESAVGLAAMNGAFHRFTGVHLSLYVITDWLGLIPIFAIFCFACLGLCQWIKRKRLLCVDKDILALGCYAIVVIAIYLLFEYVVINYRPILISGVLEASYPSSTTLLVLSVMLPVIMQCRSRIANKATTRMLTFGAIAFMLFMVCGRLLSGVHWLSDIVGGVWVSTALVFLYDAVTDVLKNADLAKAKDDLQA